MHYTRWQRHGTPLKAPNWNKGVPRRKCDPGCSCKKHKGNTTGRHVNKRTGYVVLTGIVHPLTGQLPGFTGKVYEHRMVLWNKLGCASLDCTHPCHWCGRELNWKTIRADHVDAVKTNNAPENLVPSCHGCNTSRHGTSGRRPCLTKVVQAEEAHSE